jgi:cyclophilin family peptidyl-prolyl cis-trans isomerase
MNILIRPAPRFSGSPFAVAVAASAGHKISRTAGGPRISAAKRISALAVFLLATPFAWAQNPRVEVRTSMGSFVLELYPDKAPKSVANFLKYAGDGFYSGTIFNRTIGGFMIQGGGFDRGMREKPPRAPIENEAGAALNAGLKNDIGTIAMARTPDPHSATAQFFINVANNDFLNYRDSSAQGYGYAVFGRVTEGMDTVLRISKVPTSTAGPHQNVPQQPVTIESIALKPRK